jgi:hypothetical protein
MRRCNVIHEQETRMPDLTRRKFLTGLPTVAVVAAASVAVAPLAMASAGPALATIPFGPWRPDLPETVSHTLKAGYIGLEEDFEGRAVSER